MKLIFAGALTLALALMMGCDQNKGSSGCEKDTDCKGDRICVDGECEADEASNDDDDGGKKKKKKQAAKKKKKAAKKETKQETKKGADDDGDTEVAKGGGSDFTKAEQSVWIPRLGPKMKAGSKVAHDVFVGPFGPSPKSLFAVTKRADHTFYVIVMGDDGKAWPAGPFSHPGLNSADEIQAVSFFDADGNGTTDALVMSSHIGRRGNIIQVNVLFKWTDKGLRRLLKLEEKIVHIKSAAAVKRALGR